MTRAALYARFSNDDRQNVLSAEDQLIVCRRHAEQRGWSVVAEFRDEGISGAAMANRPGILAALAAAAAGGFEILLAEDEDRVARRLSHLAFIKDELAADGVTLATLHLDAVETMHVAFKGAVAEQYLVDLSRKTSRGMRRNAQKGLATGARVYGYRGAPGGAVTIVEAEAAVIREIFTAYAAGQSPREIAADLNARHVPAALGGTWAANAINGNARRANGVLHCELYAGVKVWNRLEVKKDPRTGRRRPIVRPESEWQRTPVEHLRIVPAELWNAAQGRRRSYEGREPGQIAAARKGPFSGLLKCGCCGASYTSWSKVRLACAANREKGPAVCANGAKPRRALIEARILKGLRERLASPEAAAAYVRIYHAAFAEEAAQRQRDRAPVERRLAELGRRIERLVEEICEGHGPRVRAKLQALEAEEAELRAQLERWDAEAAAPPIALHPAAPGQYAHLVDQLAAELYLAGQGALAGDAHDRSLLEAIRALVLRVDITPEAAAPDGLRLAIVGDLAMFLQGPEAESPGAPTVGWKVVAGGRFSQTPHTPIPVTIAA